MQDLRRTFVSRCAGPIAAAVATAWLAACEPGATGVSPEAPGATDLASAEAAYLVFGPMGAKAATLPDEGVSVTRVVDEDGVVLRVYERNGPGHRDDLDVRLEVPAGAAPEGTAITMTVRGNLLSRLVIGFEPSGLLFAKPAVIRIDVGRDLVDVDLSNLEVYHIFADGTKDLVAYRLEEYRDSIRIWVAIGGFSRYSLSDGR